MDEVQQLGRAYHQELKWVMERQLPPFEDYVKNSEITSCIFIMFAAIIPGFKSLTQETIDWMKSDPKIATSTGMIGRYWDDIGSHHRESKGGQVLTAIDSYMKQHGVTKQERLSEFAQQVEEAWMDVNKEWVETAFVPREIALQFLSYARMCDASYNHNNGDAYTDPQMGKTTAIALFNVFNKFVNKDGMFEEGDVEGMLSLYEAAHVRFRDEKILQEAADFTRRYLKRNKAELKSGLKDRVKRALERPLHRDSSIFYARIFIPIYETDPSRNELLLKLAKFNFNFLQKLYRKELSQLSRWWKELDLKSKLAYARDRVVEAYVWGVGYHYEPEYSYVRIGLAKAVLVVGVMDDTYDNYATINEAQLFTHILERWNMDEVDRLPEYMKIVYHFMLSTCDDYESDALKLGQAFATPYFKETVQQLGRAYSQELKWVMGRQMPPFKDYVKNSEITSAIYSMFAFTIPGLKSVSQETIDWLKSEPKIAISSGLAGRYLDDIGSHERESKGGQMLTAVDCYMKQHGVTKQEALSKFAQLYEEEWMDLNREWVETAFVPTEIAIEFLNYARMIDATYSINSGDAYTDPQKGKSTVVALFIDPILI
ncbi:hypothetical protein SASPL_100264 [Salvia splendens]|uniref:Viridiflorene synthase n=1 Tax=Salvia splendens TaxID=180675 RepID=A0A8X9AA47_SALSN|nr:hypothetical protein SASPL_100264 [Salvia splendens]